MVLKDKEIRWYPKREGFATAIDKPHFFSEDVKETVKKFEHYICQFLMNRITKIELAQKYKDIFGEFK